MNGPKGGHFDWHAVNWHAVEEDVRRLRHRIFVATEAGDLKKVRNLQKLMLRSRSNALLSVRRVTEINAGRKTAGIDGEVAIAPEEKAELVSWMRNRTSPWSPRPVKRVYVPKRNGRRRPLGIPVIADRCLQALVTGALEPEWEARFEPRSYGFRPGRGCHDAIVAIHTSASSKAAKRQWVLDADLQEAFDRLSHDHILQSIERFPGRGLIAQWLRAGVVEAGQFTPTEEGTPQGGVISPLLMNVALHGMESAAGVRYHKKPSSDSWRSVPGSPVLVRYADDLLVLCHSKEQAEDVKQRLAAWLRPRGLAFNEAKTRITHLDEGVDFLGFNIRRFRGKLLTKPSNDALRRIRKRLSDEALALRGGNADAVVGKLNPIIKGWAAYYRIGVSSKAFATLDNHVWRLVYKWARFSHSNKSAGWVTSRYFGLFNRGRQDRWVFGSRESGRYLRRFAWTPIVRHRMVAWRASPDDPSLAAYWAARRRRSAPPIGRDVLWLLQRQRGRCTICRGLLLYADHEPQWETWLSATRKGLRKRAITPLGQRQPGDRVAQHLVHAQCHRKTNGNGAQR
ncbi:group II intron reverse transcriptase/maturase [Streptomyces cucumeris]|uniref:group II intron reverse transcriptase/maturase n=1 Tax=Streptomyces cucumeris TaxID=2962890 RepID=UPI0020C8CFEE|nr:group II intron reverse transcriptase/maturase [Streptomyces sp. NEAU-Y11]MCP9211625.1 group II intron reverse transcriptase/maturase [Streptomyces sp. NEAU-Y11]MCP9213318.1 group II intron reverse transcriptase/maturase [Streptomyces sp. NEAU-Y11]